MPPSGADKHRLANLPATVADNTRPSAGSVLEVRILEPLAGSSSGSASVFASSAPATMVSSAPREFMGVDFLSHNRRIWGHGHTSAKYSPRFLYPMKIESETVTGPRNRHERRAIEAGHRLAYSVDGFCEASNTGRSKVYELIRTGRLRAKKFGSKTLILAEDANAFLASLPDMRTDQAAVNLDP